MDGLERVAADYPQRGITHRAAPAPHRSPFAGSGAFLCPKKTEKKLKKVVDMLYPLMYIGTMMNEGTASEAKGYKMRASLIKNLGITEEQLKTAKGMVTDGYGRDAVAEELNLHKYYRPCEYSNILAHLVTW